MSGPLRKNESQIVLIIVIIILANNRIDSFTEHLLQLFPLLTVLQDIVFFLDCHDLVLLTSVLVQLDSFICLQNCVLDRTFILPDFALGNPVLESLLHPVELPVSQMVDPVLQKHLSVLLEFNDLLPLLDASLSFHVVKPCKSVGHNPVGLRPELSLLLTVVIDVLSVVVHNFAEVFIELLEFQCVHILRMFC